MVASCGSSDAPTASSCAPRDPQRIVDSPLNVTDQSVTVPEGTLDMNGDGKPDDVRVENGAVTVNDLVLTTTSPAGLSIRTWADLDGDGDDDLLVDDGRSWLIEGGKYAQMQGVRTVGVRIDDRFTTMWPASLDGTAGGDFYIVRQAGTHTVTDVYSGSGLLRNADPVVQTQLSGAPRAVAHLEKGGPLETVLLDAGPPSTLTFAPRTRPALRADLGESHRVTWVRVFDQGGTRKIALQIDRNVAVWPVPPVCSG